MTAISEREAKHQYYWSGGNIVAYSLKVASTYLHAHRLSITGRGLTRSDRYKRPRIGQSEAVAAREAGTDVHLIVRHPLDRLVSNWAYWTKKANGYIRPLAESAPEDHAILMGTKIDPRTGEKPGLEEWFEASTRHYNPHWYGQWEYHTTPEGALVPNILWPMESLNFMPATADAGIVNASPREKRWEDYYSDSFRKTVEDYYAKDIELYEKSKEMWDGCSCPTILRGPK